MAVLAWVLLTLRPLALPDAWGGFSVTIKKFIEIK